MPGPRIIVCSGLERSGVTWIYNVARLLSVFYGDSIYATGFDRWDYFNEAKTHVVKVYSRDLALARDAKCILTGRRDLRDIAASQVIRGWVPPIRVLEWLDFAVAQHEYWSELSHCEIVYERMVDNRDFAVRRIAKAMGLSPSTQDVRDITELVESLRYHGPGDVDPTNLLHKLHRRNGKVGYYKTILSDWYQKEIESRYHDWLCRYGYLEPSGS